MPPRPTDSQKVLGGNAVKGRFDRDRFAESIQGLGMLFRWSRAIHCACVLDETNPNSGFDPGCTRCLGLGLRWVNPWGREQRHAAAKDFVELRCAFGQAALDQKFDTDNLGGWDFSDALMTVQSDMNVGYRDRFVGVEQLMTYGQRLKRLSAARLPLGLVGRSLSERFGALRYEPVWVHHVEDQDGVAYWQGLDFSLVDITVNGRAVRVMDWVTGRGPDVGAFYSISYTCRPVWVVDSGTYQIQHALGPEHTLSGDDGPRSLPTTFKVRLEFLALQQDTA